MRTLILVRHGAYGHDRHLNSEGRAQVLELSRCLRSVIDGGKVAVLSSTAPRSVDSAEILTREFGISEFARHDLLWSGGDNKVGVSFPGEKQFGELVELLSGLDHDVVVVVTHLEFVKGFPWYFGKNVLDAQLPYEEISKGTAWVIDIKEKICKHVG